MTSPFLNLDWTVADVDRVIELAGRGVTTRQIAVAMQRKELDVIALCQRNEIPVRMRRRVG